MRLVYQTLTLREHPAALLRALCAN